MTLPLATFWTYGLSSDQTSALTSKEALSAQRGFVVIGPPPAIVEPRIVRTVVMRQQPFAGSIQRLESFRDLGADWDSYGGVPISEDAIRMAVRLLNELSFKSLAPDLAPSHVAPVSDGGVLIEWRRPNGRALELWIDSAGNMERLLEDQSVDHRFHEQSVPTFPIAVAEVEAFAR